jgi:catalase
MLRSTLITLMLVGLASVAAADTVYKWVDRGGQVHYTDLPPDQPDAKLLGVFERDMVMSGDEEAGPGDTGADTYDSGPALEEAASADAATAVQRDLDAVRSGQCKQAQERYKTYIESRRLFRETPDGKREYLTDAELSEARIQAKKDMDELCR